VRGKEGWMDGERKRGSMGGGWGEGEEDKPYIGQYVA
jgi:hypothetical protein